jgi:lipopolysaccharide export system protein LptC
MKPGATPVTKLRATPREAVSTRESGLLGLSGGRHRNLPSRGDILRRRVAIRVTKYVLPAAALCLLSLIALWPQLHHSKDHFAYDRSAAAVSGATVENPVYRGMDDHGRPYTVTSADAVEVAPNQFRLATPKADVLLQNGTWMMVQSDDGMFLKLTSQLDLSGNVVIYRSDGTTLHTPSIAVELKLGAASGSQPVHVEGPSGTLDAMGMTVVDKGATIQFGPGQAMLNAATREELPQTAAADSAALPDAPPAPVTLSPVTKP